MEERKNYATYSDGKVKRYLYDHGLPFSKKLDQNLDDLRKRIKSKKASLMIIDGGIGEGKTTLAVHCAEYFTKTPLKFKRQLGMGGVDFQEKLQISIDSGFKVAIYDEAGDFDKRGSITKFNMSLNRVFDTYRTYGILVIIILPNFNVLDNSLFDKQIPRLLIHCYGRNDYYGNYKVYSLYRMFYLKKRMKDLTVKPHAYGMVDPNFVGHFLDLIPERSEELDKYSTTGKKEIITNNILKAKGLISYMEISKQVNKSIPWIKRKVKDLSIKPAHVYKRRNFYNVSIVEMLREEM